jgi:uncharacterized protein (DUF1778 family)
MPAKSLDMAREIKAIVELTEAQMREFMASLYNPENIRMSAEANRKSKKIHFNVL